MLKLKLVFIGILGIVMGKLNQKWKPCLIILYKIDICIKIDFNSAVLFFGLAITLSVKCNK